MLTLEIKDWPNRHNVARIDFSMRHIVMTFDMIKVYRFGNAVVLIYIHQIALEIVVVADAAQTALKMDVVDDIETNEGAE